MRELQKKVIENKKEKGFYTEHIEQELLLLIGEVSELYSSITQEKEDINEEIADIGIYLLGISELLGFDLKEEILKKMEKNKKRTYLFNDKGNVVGKIEGDMNE